MYIIKQSKNKHFETWLREIKIINKKQQNKNVKPKYQQTLQTRA